MDIETVFGYQGGMFGPTFSGSEKEVRQQKLEEKFYDLFHSAADFNLAMEESMQDLKEKFAKLDTRIDAAKARFETTRQNPYAGFATPELS